MEEYQTGRLLEKWIRCGYIGILNEIRKYKKK